MKLVWAQFDKPSEFGVEYRAWGVSSPYRIQLVGNEIVAEKIGVGRKPHRWSNHNGSSLDNVRAIVQRWEDEDQRHLVALGYPEYPRV